MNLNHILRLSDTDDVSDIKLSYLEINGRVLSKQRKKTEKLLLLLL